MTSNGSQSTLAATIAKYIRGTSMGTWFQEQHLLSNPKVACYDSHVHAALSA
ncbi:hypothetical protein VFPPC_16657 [Pochonia chlamydosporia 170]|uniref:Uncharacterized protein n=1 Tax=Pochonia chlamydosporia 170 TaxID=1380566 RepID=A0A179FBF5_METCM|nr:hypothetical protein VFPPC_16657 [Pochonia chlamydosporia 170]OAQ62439.2 hypothetical protein VFPPC_16657 [Pochonia chlamydosporia 170]